MSILSRIFITTGPDHAADEDPAIAETLALIAECEKIIARPRAHPMAKYWANVRLASATNRLRHLTYIQERDAKLKHDRTRYAPKPAQTAGDHRDPMAKYLK